MEPRTVLELHAALAVSQDLRGLRVRRDAVAEINPPTTAEEGDRVDR